MNKNDYQIEFKTSPRQLAFAQRVLEAIKAEHPEAIGEVENNHGFITVKAYEGSGLCRRDWLFQIGIRCGITNLYNKKSVRFYLVANSYIFTI